MTYIENIFLCMVSPLLVAALCMGRRQLRFFLFCIAGMGVCLLSAYINTFLAAVCQADALAATAEIAPVVEEIMKLLPLVFYLLVFEPEGDKIKAAAITVALAFATFENVCYLIQNGADRFSFIFFRGFGTGAMHVLCGLIVGGGLAYTWQRTWLKIAGTCGLLGAAITLHAIYNLLIAYGGAALGVIMAATQLRAGKIDLAGALLIVLLAADFFIPMRQLGSFFHIAMNGMAASDKIFKILDLPEPQTGERTLPDGPLDVVLEDVHFSYEEDREILKGIDLTLPAGSFVSLVGESGCGKSTIAGILAAKNRGYAGSITLGGVPLSEVNETDLMKHVVLVRHNSYLFKGTVEENLRMAKPDATKEEMEAVLQKVNLLGFLQTQNGLQTELLEKAGNLSGGQCQRLVIARALLRSDSAVYIFDEAASNIDVDSEELIMNVIHELAKTKTVLLISHRLANVVQSDQIYFLKNGTICERGTHAELMEQNGAYRHLYDSQMVLENYGKEGNA